MPALAGQLARALPTVDPVSNIREITATRDPVARVGPLSSLMLVTRAREPDPAEPSAAADTADATGPAGSPARLTNLREIPATRGRLLRFGSLLSLMLVTAAREPCPADAAGPAESPARLTNLRAISAVRGGSARFGPVFALMLVTHAARSRSLEGIAEMSP
ncbi:hypothetical protein C5E05_09175 [Pseudoclavibacter sp. AY1H1]|nr:hypothetical protein C5E05_09175 [Pseudoclavibacter sp. AY1H1]